LLALFSQFKSKTKKIKAKKQGEREKMQDRGNQKLYLIFSIFSNI
jgi:hypothetical protein